MAEKKNRLRPTQLHFYVNDQEFELIKSKMKQVGTDNLSDYLRKMAIDGYVRGKSAKQKGLGKTKSFLYGALRGREANQQTVLRTVCRRARKRLLPLPRA